MTMTTAQSLVMDVWISITCRKLAETLFLKWY